MSQSIRDDVAMLAKAPLVTGRFQSFRPEQGVPIRASIGAPKFPWRGPPLVFLRDLAPKRRVAFDPTMSDADARIEYLARLDERTTTLVRALGRVARAFPGQQLTVLCYENVQAGETCHRRWFAEWFQARFGVEVPEVDDQHAVIDADQPQLPW